MNKRRSHFVDMRMEPDSKGRVRIMATGDWHLGSLNCDEDRVRRDLQRAIDNNWYVICMGDQLETATKSSPGSGVFEQDEPDEQINRIVELLKPVADAGLLIGIHHGNHENRIVNLAGVNVTKMVCRILGCKYLNHAAMHNWKVGKQSYTAYSTHGSSGSRLPWTKVKAAIDCFRFVDAELVLYAHTHGLDHATQLYQRVDKKNRKVEHGIRHAVLTGSYLRYPGSYAEQKNYPPVPMGCALITLFADHHEIRVTL